MSNYTAEDVETIAGLRHDLADARATGGDDDE